MKNVGITLQFMTTLACENGADDPKMKRKKKLNPSYALEEETEEEEFTDLLLSCANCDRGVVNPSVANVFCRMTGS